MTQRPLWLGPWNNFGTTCCLEHQVELGHSRGAFDAGKGQPSKPVAKIASDTGSSARPAWLSSGFMSSRDPPYVSGFIRSAVERSKTTGWSYTAVPVNPIVHE